MELISVKEAAKYVGVSSRTINYWVKNGYVKKYPNGKRVGKSECYFIDKAEVEKVPAYKERFDLEIKIRKHPDNFILPKEAAKILNVTRSVITYYINRGYLTRHYILGSKKNYALDRNEVYEVPLKTELALSKELIKDQLREHTKKMKRDANGWFLKNE